MHATLTFNLPEEQEEFETYNKAYKYYAALFDLSNYLRGLEKSGLNPPVHEIRQYFYEIAGDLLD